MLYSILVSHYTIPPSVALTNCRIAPPPLFFFSPNRGVVCNVLLTCCKDSVCRLWAETLLPGDSLLSGHHNNHIAGQHSDTLRCAGSSRKNTCNGKTQGRTAQEVSHFNVTFARQKKTNTRLPVYLHTTSQNQFSLIQMYQIIIIGFQKGLNTYVSFQVYSAVKFLP